MTDELSPSYVSIGGAALLVAKSQPYATFWPWTCCLLTQGVFGGFETQGEHSS